MEDLRTQKTKKAIEQATIELIELKGFSKVRMNEIAQRAVVNRNTIYLHYESKEDIVVSILEHHFSFNKILMVAGRLLKTKMSREELRDSFYKLLEAMERDIELFRIVITDPNLNGYLTSVNNKIKELAYRSIDQDATNRTIIEYIVSGTFGVIVRWIIYANESIDKIADELTELTYANMKMLKR
ncbi:MAG: TetR/AcrR family transcriptional regulator [Bacilli bacterium]|nr:TetR/AcrR family transcriptional regulator [Bacilli bacterium]